MLKNRLLKIAGVPVVIVLAMVISGCSHQPVSEEQTREQTLHKLQAYAAQIPEQERRTRLFALLEDLADGLVNLSQTVDQFSEDTKQLNMDYDATRDDFQKLMARFNTARLSIQDRVVTTHFKIKALTSEKEWADIVKIENKAIDKILRQNLLETYPQPES